MRVVLCTGGSGGHLFPAIKVAQKLSALGHKVLFIGSVRVGAATLEREGFPFVSVGGQGLNGNVMTFGFSLLAATAKAWMRMCTFHPNVVIGFGSYASAPGILAGALLGVPRLIHEQNVIPGKANKFLQKWANKITISFESTGKYFSSNKTVLTGCPSHTPQASLTCRDILADWNLKEGVATILVFGGSQGSERINQVFLEAARTLKKSNSFQVIHLVGKGEAEIREAYKTLGIDCAVFDFLDGIERAYTASNVVLSRAGAVTVTELALFGRPAVLIPYPHADGHQTHNARVLEEAHQAQVIEEKDLTPEKLCEALKAALAQKDQRLNQNNKGDDAAQKLAQQALSLAV